MRRTLEATIIAALPFDCYFVDLMHQIDMSVVTRLFHAAKLRGAGVIFATARLPQAVRFASSGAIASNGQLTWADNLQETLASHG